MLGLEEFRKSPEEFMAKDRRPKNMKGEGRDEERGEGKLFLVIVFCFQLFLSFAVFFENTPIHGGSTHSSRRCSW